MRWLLLLLALCAAVSARADSPNPAGRNGNVYGGFNHQPTRSQVETRERSAGLAPDSSQQAAQDSTIRHLYEELEQQQRTD